ncbi:hypothetical protein ACNKHU_12845 [Shigella flexneri]
MLAAATRCFHLRRSTLRSRLLPQVSLITQNLPEAAALLDAPHARTEQGMLNKGNHCRRSAVAGSANERW